MLVAISRTSVRSLHYQHHVHHHGSPLSRLVAAVRNSSPSSSLPIQRLAFSTSQLRAPTDPHVKESTENPTRTGTTTPVLSQTSSPKCPFYFAAGYALFAKRPSRPFPPPFLSLPSTSFSEPLSTHHRSRDRRPKVDGELIRGITNGDDAVLVSEGFIGVDDGVGAWGQREKGHAALWSRLILHFWAIEVEKAHSCHSSTSPQQSSPPNPISYLQTAFEATKRATSEPNEWFGTTTACSALLTYDGQDPAHPILYVTQLGDSQIMVIRPEKKEKNNSTHKDGTSEKEANPKDLESNEEAKPKGDIIFKTEEQWHWFDCPRQLGTNSPDTPEKNAVLDRIQIEEDDVVLAMTDGVVDNLWEHEVVQNVLDSMNKWDTNELTAEEPVNGSAEDKHANKMRFVAQELVNAARAIAEDPFAESPYMEKAVDEGLSIEGGKLDDISVVAAQCKRRDG